MKYFAKIFAISALGLIGSQTMAQDTKIKFFGQPGFDLSSNSKTNTNSAYFRTAEFVIFATSQLSENISVSGELRPHYMANGRADIEIERLYLRYQINDILNLRVGKTFLPNGFWNQNYNFGYVLNPTISRPLMLNTTDDGGVAPVRAAGIMLEGDNITPAGLFFKLFVHNGAGKNGGLLGGDYMLGSTIASTAQVGISPVDGLRISASYYFDKLQKGRTDQFGNTLATNINYSILTGSISYLNLESKIEAIAECYYHTRNYDSTGMDTRHLNGGIVYAGYKLTDKIIPYLIGETIHFDSNDSYFPTFNEDLGRNFTLNTTNILAGFRYRINPNLVFKTEAGISNIQTLDNTFLIKTQLAFGF